MKIPNLPSVRLSNGLVVANYSSPHTFLFEDGSILGECSDERAKLTIVESNENTVATRKILREGQVITTLDVETDWELSWFVKEDMIHITAAYVRNELDWDIIITPLPVMMGWRKYRKNLNININQGPFRTGRLINRLEPKQLSIIKFHV